jgi:thiosulfate/3-mercaptopyruvate sulfurtransferase
MSQPLQCIKGRTASCQKNSFLAKERNVSATLLCSFALLALVQPAKSYARPDLLIEAAELAKPENAKKFRILDTRAAREWDKAHIPFSIAVDVAQWNKQFTKEQDTQAWEMALGGLGIDIDVPVVISGEDVKEMARAWWILRYWGVKDVRLLNGGWSAWTAGNLAVDRGPDKKPHSMPTMPKLVPAEKRLATLEQIKSSLKEHTLQLVDARSEGEFCGDTRTAKRSGAIPGAVNLEWKQMVDAKTNRFKSAGELDQLFKKAGIDLTKPAVTYCQSGGRSSVMAFALDLMGGADVRNYYRSWVEWGNTDDTPIVVPKK